MKGWMDCSISQVSSVVCGVYIILGESESVTPAVCESLVWLVEVGEVEENRRLGMSCDAPKQTALARQRTTLPISTTTHTCTTPCISMLAL